MSAGTQIAASHPEKTKQNIFRTTLSSIGRWTVSLARPIVKLSSMAVAVCWQSLRPLNWRRTLVQEFFRQCGLIGIGALSFILLSGLLIGLAMVVQFLYWLGLAGQSSLVGEIIVLVMIREIAPLLVALIIVGRSGSVNMVELAYARTSGQLRMLDAQGIDPFLFFIIPRSLATAISMFCLNVVFILTALLTGYLIGDFVDPSDTTLLEFLNEVLAAMGMGEYAIMVLKPLIMGLFISLITCASGLAVEGRARQVTDILPLGYVKSVLAVLLVSGTLSMML